MSKVKISQSVKLTIVGLATIAICTLYYTEFQYMTKAMKFAYVKTFTLYPIAALSGMSIYYKLGLRDFLIKGKESDHKFTKAVDRIIWGSMIVFLIAGISSALYSISKM